MVNYMDKKILILSMSCRDDFFITQENVIKETWAKPILEGKYNNIDICFYRGTTEKHSYNKQDHLLQVRCEDDQANTFKKTYYALSLIKNTNLFEYDYIFRTNTSTFVNIELLNAFVQQLDNEDIIYTSELYSLSEAYVPRPLNLYGRGNGLLISKKNVEVILKEGLNLLYLEIVDDVAIGNIMNSYFIKQDKNYLDYINAYTHGWYKCVPGNCGNQSLCQFSNNNEDFNFLNKFITIQIKKYRHRHDENDNYYELDKIFSNNKYEDISKQIKFVNEYSKNPDIFIGSILGYIKYNVWYNMDKNKLFELEINHKAADDEQLYKHKDVLY